MITIKSNQTDYIELYLSAPQDKYCRFPNQMIWDVNTYLSNSLKLYEYYFSKKKVHIPHCISLPGFSLSFKYLCFSDLDPMYIKLINFDEEEYREEYRKHLFEFDNFSQFLECYSMEEITEMQYIAVSDLSRFIEEFSKRMKGTIFKCQSLISKAVDSLSDVSIHIGDHCYMIIRSRHPKIISEILKIIETYQDA